MTVFHVFANRSNAGDWLSAIGIQSLLGEVEVVELLCDEPFVDATLRTLEKAQRDDFVIIGGGGLFMDYFNHFWEGLACIQDRLRYCLWGVGYVDLKREPSQPPATLLQSIAKASALCRVRDEHTRSILADSSLPPPAICPSIAAPDLEPSSSSDTGLLHAANLTTVGEVAFMRMDYEGRRFAAATSRPFWETNNRLIKGGREELGKLVERYRASDVVLSSRLHGCIFALAFGRRVVAVSGDWKIDAFMRAAGLADWLCQFNQVEGVADLLHSVSQQVLPEDFITEAKQQNAEIAQEVLSLL